MTTAQIADGTQAAALGEKLLESAVSTMETMSVLLGLRLGLYQALEHGPADPRQLAERAGIHPRYAREWLEQQTVAGVVKADGDNQRSDPYARRFRLPEGHRIALLDTDSPYYLGAMPGFVVGFADVLPQLELAYRTGGGVPYAAYGESTRRGIGALNRPMFRAHLGEWVAAMPELERRLSDGPANVLDLGCGTGASSLAIATHFPRAQVHGVDLDQPSVAEAREAATRAGLSARVRFSHGDAASVPAGERYDLVTVFEALHDMADPVATLRAVGGLLAGGGAILVGDERVAEEFGALGDPLERLNYGFSVLHCLPATRAEGTSVEAGTVLRPATVRQYAGAAGLSCTVLPVAHDLWRFYRLDRA